MYGSADLMDFFIVIKCVGVTFRPVFNEITKASYSVYIT